jgi:hypothetical protein
MACQVDWERTFILLAVLLACLGFWLLIGWGAATLLHRFPG